MSELFQQRPADIYPQIYGYTEPQYPGQIKVGYTDKKNVEERIWEQFPTLKPGDKPFKIVFTASAMRADGSIMTDAKVREMIATIPNCKIVVNNAGKKTEWCKCTVRDIEMAMKALKERRTEATERTRDFEMRPEQKDAVQKTMAYYKSFKEDVDGEVRIPKYLWNCKMRFGKTFASYQLAKAMGFKRILILTFKPAVKSAWKDDLLTHVDFEGWTFISRPAQTDLLNPPVDQQYDEADKSKPIVCFGSFQDLLGVDNDTGTIKSHNEFIHLEDWDLVIFDEYHFGAWREKAKQLFEQEDEEKLEEGVSEKYDRDDVVDESFLPIHTNHYLFLSGTPFRALNSGEFIEEQIFSWSYTDEQKAKEEWPNLSSFPDYVPKTQETNPYRALPKMVMLTYRVPDSIRKVAIQTDTNEFDLNQFFEARGLRNNAEFVLKDEVQKWLDLIRGSYLETAVDDLKLGRKAPFPYSDVRLRNVLNHTLWYMPSVASCYAMRNLMREQQNTFYRQFKVIVCAGSEAGQGAEALVPVEAEMDDPLNSQTITLSCGKLTTGVTVKPWTGVFMLRNLSQPESYFQTAFRVQSPWSSKDAVTHEEIIYKEECYVFDFEPNRTLRQLAEYANRLNTKERNPEKKVADFIHFLPVLSYDGMFMRQIDAAEILDMAMSGTTATLLARRWESALLVNVDNATLLKLLNNPQALAALMSIEGFRNLNRDIQTIVNKSEEVKKAKKEGKDKNGTETEKKELSQEEKEFKSKRKEIQEKLIKFATRIPIFMYLTDFREACLQDVITQLEPELFKRVTGLNVKDFELLASIGVFNESLMNDAVFKFRRYEDASLEYTGINRHEGEKVGGWSTTATKEDLDIIFGEEAVFDNSYMVGDSVWFNGKKAVVNNVNPSKGKIWLTVDGKKMTDPYNLNTVIDNGMLAKTKTFADYPPMSETHSMAAEVPKEKLRPAAETEQSTSDEKEEEPKSEKMEAPEGGWSTDPRSATANPAVSVGEQYENDVYGLCTVTGLRLGKVDMKTKKGKGVIFIYPDAFVNGKLRKVRN